MNLEAIEERCTLVLTESANPLVSLDVLIAHLQQDPECAGIDPTELLEFLGPHPLFKVVEPITVTAGTDAAKQFAKAGFSLAPRVILRERVPTPSDIMAQMNDELSVLADSLNRALADAERRAAADDASQARALLSRVHSLQDRLRQEN